MARHRKRLSAEERQKKREASRKRGIAYWKKKRERTEGLTEGEIKNGWTAFELQKLIREDDEALNRQLGLGGRKSTDQPAYGADYYNPHDW